MSAQTEKLERFVPSDVEMARCWTEDFTRENGIYSCTCSLCGEHFIGHKRRVICKVCAKQLTPIDRYEITPLRWVEHGCIDTHLKNAEYYTAHTIFGEITVNSDFNGWYYEYRFEGKYNEEKVYCYDRIDAQKRAELLYRDSLMPALTKTKPA